MKIEKELFEYYSSRISEKAVPPVPDLPETEKLSSAGDRSGVGYAAILAAAAALMIAFMPIAGSPARTSELSLRAAEYSRRNELGNRISEGLINLREIAEYSTFSGGKQ